MEIWNYLLPALCGGLAGGLRSVAGFFDAKKDEPKITWDWSKCLQSFVRGFVGGLATVPLVAGSGLSPLLSVLTSGAMGMSVDVLAHDVGIKK